MMREPATNEARRAEGAFPWRPFVVHALFVALIVVGTAAFTLFFNVYDTLSTTLLVTGYDWLALIVPGMLTGILTLLVELGLLRWRGLWRARPWSFYLRLILLCAWWMSLGNALNAFVMGAPETFLTGWSVILGMPLMAAFFAPMALPFSLFVGSGCAFLLRKYYGRNRTL